jgi:hypothetical protein
MNNRTKELLLSCGEDIVQRRYYRRTPTSHPYGFNVLFCSKPADGLRSLDDVRTVASPATTDLNSMDRSQVIQLQITLERALGAVLSLRNEFSPVNRLPTETLSHIFDLACIEDRDDDHHAHASHATTLAQVCSQWRSNVVSTPLLWSTIHVSRDIQPEFVALCLDRSKDVPLRIILEAKGGLMVVPGLPAYTS